MTQEYFLSTITDVLKPGIENAISLEYLCSYYGVSERVVRKFLHHARTNGIPILSSTKYGGYYLPKDQKEAQEFIRSQTNRAKACFASLKAVKEYVKSIDNSGQMSLDMDA
jgi:biotin operon repressor